MSKPMPGAEGQPACPGDGWGMPARWSHHRAKRHIRADQLSGSSPADFQARSDIAIRRHQVPVNCAFSFC